MPTAGTLASVRIRKSGRRQGQGGRGKLRCRGPCRHWPTYVALRRGWGVRQVLFPPAGAGYVFGRDVEPFVLLHVQVAPTPRAG